MRLSTLKDGMTNVVLKKVRHGPGADSLTMQCSSMEEIRLNRISIIEGHDHIWYIRLGCGDLLPIYSDSDWEWEADGESAQANGD